MAEENNHEFRKGDMVTMDPDPPHPPVSDDYDERLKSKKNGTVYDVDTKSTGDGNPVVLVRWLDIPNDVRVYPCWELVHAKEGERAEDRPRKDIG
ncbi:MAG: hypothetical protein ACYCO5_10275 [Acidobacteriaceae bacterium]